MSKVIKGIKYYLRLLPTLIEQQRIIKETNDQIVAVQNSIINTHEQIIETNNHIIATHNNMINTHEQIISTHNKMINTHEQLIQNGQYIVNIQNKIAIQLDRINETLKNHGIEILQIKSNYENFNDRFSRGFTIDQISMITPRLRRNLLPNDNNALQKTLMAMWKSQSTLIIGYKDILESGFRVFSQNDEDGMLLRIFSHIGLKNKYVVEIGSNCSGSDIGIPENLSTNLIVNHGWHGSIIEIDKTECERIRYFFSRDFATKHFHMVNNGMHSYFSPVIVQKKITAENVDQVLNSITEETEPDLMAIDIDGGDYATIRSMNALHPRVLVVEFEKRFRDRYSVVQFDSSEFSKKWPQSGAASLPAWEKLLCDKGYTLCAIGTCGFNAFFIRSDIASKKFLTLTSSEAFDKHPILSKVSREFWLLPDETWSLV